MQNQLILFLFIGILSSCSSLSSLNFWSDDSDEDISKPAELVSFQEEASVNVVWKKSFKSSNELGSFKPAFYAGQMLVADSDGEITSLNPKTGKVNWTKTLERELAAGVVSGFGKFVVSDTEGNVLGFDLESQESLWETNIGGEVLANAVIDASLVVVKNSVGELVALDSSSGEQKWTFRSQLPALTVRGTGEPIIKDGIVFSTFDNGRLGAFQLNTGFFLWDGPISFVAGSSELENLLDADSSPVFANQLIFATNYQGNLTAFDLAQKRPVWNSKASSFHSPVIGQGMIMVIQDDGSIISFSSSNLAPSWVSEEYKIRDLSNGEIFENYMLVGDLEGYLHLINPMTGKTVGRKKVSGNPIKSLVTYGGLAYTIDQDSNLVAISL
ncbi:outer membrane protein assembly factor BamB [Pseudomonadota bacterium]|nr:outer membrane protein assembly factor BamB [Pseudomonadota bacterium]